MIHLALYLLLVAALCAGGFVLLRRFERKNPFAYRRARSAAEPYIFILPVLLPLLLLFGYPLINTIVMAFKNYK
jgi:multiple sugar transport system permease protein